MNFELHPIFVHLPIAFLAVYSIVKILPLQRWFPGVAWRHTERLLLAVGVVGAFLADVTGEVAEKLSKADETIIEAHVMFAVVSSLLYGILLAGEVLAVINLSFIQKIPVEFIKKLSFFFERILCNKIFTQTTSFLGLLAIIMTGLLGGVLVHGIIADPLAPFVLKLLDINF